MSDEKYIINKDSLTGIADAVRDKLGVGKATTDPQTGDIVYPEGKGYYIENEDVEVIAVPNGSGSAYGRGTSSSAAWTEKQIIDISSSVYSQKIEKPFYQLEVQGCFYTTLSYNTLGHADLSLQMSSSDSSRTELQNDNTILQKVTKNFDSAQNRLYIRLIMVINTYNSEAYYYTRFKVLLKDENGVPIKLISSGFPYKSYTIETVPGIKKPIPYSVADIKNNIKDYWSIPEGSLNISANGTYDVTDKASAIVNVSSGGGGGGGTAERWLVKNIAAGRGPFTLPTDLDTFEKFSTRIRAIQLNGCSGEVLFKTDGTLCSYKDLNMAAPSVVNNMISGSISDQDVIDAYNDDRLFVVISYKYNNKYQVYMGFKNNQIFFGADRTSVGLNPGAVVLFYV